MAVVLMSIPLLMPRVELHENILKMCYNHTSKLISFLKLPHLKISIKGFVWWLLALLQAKPIIASIVSSLCFPSISLHLLA